MDVVKTNAVMCKCINSGGACQRIAIAADKGRMNVVTYDPYDIRLSCGRRVSLFRGKEGCARTRCRGKDMPSSYAFHDDFFLFLWMGPEWAPYRSNTQRKPICDVLLSAVVRVRADRR